MVSELPWKWQVTELGFYSKTLGQEDLGEISSRRPSVKDKLTYLVLAQLSMEEKGYSLED